MVLLVLSPTYTSNVSISSRVTDVPNNKAPLPTIQVSAQLPSQSLSMVFPVAPLLHGSDHLQVKLMLGHFSAYSPSVVIQFHLE